MKKLLPIFVLIFAFTAFGQSEKASLNSWCRLKLDKSTTEAAKNSLGEAAKDKENQNFMPLVYF